MPLYEYQCQDCEDIQDVLITINRKPKSLPCPVCGGNCTQIITMRNTAPIDSAWIKDVLKVVDKSGTKPHCNEFLKHHTRDNYQAWMKGEGLRPLEENEPTEPKFDKAAELAIREKVLGECYMKNSALSI